MADDRERRRSRWAGIAGLSAVRLWTRTVRTRSGRLVATVAAVGLALAVCVGTIVAVATGWQAGRYARLEHLEGQ